MSDSKVYGVLTPIQKETLSYLIYNPVNDRLEASKPLQTTLESFFLGDIHAMCSGGTQVHWSNYLTELHTVPVNTRIGFNAEVGGRWVDNTPVARQCGDYVISEPAGDVGDGVSVFDYNEISTIPTGISNWGHAWVAGEDYTGTLKYNIRTELTNKVLLDRSYAVDVVKGDLVTKEFNHSIDYPINVSIHFALIKDDGTYMKVYGNSINTRHWVRMFSRSYEDVPVALLSDIDGACIKSPDELKSLCITDTPTLIYNDNTRDRMKFDSSGAKIFSPNGTDYLKVLGTSVGFVMDGSNALHITSSQARLSSTDGNNYFKAKNASIQIKQNNKEKLWMDTASTDLRGPAGEGGAEISIEVTVATIKDGTRDRLRIDSSYARMYAPGGVEIITVSDTGAAFNDGTRDRVYSSSLFSVLMSPDGIQNISVGDSGAFYKGDEVATLANIKLNTDAFNNTWGGTNSFLAHEVTALDNMILGYAAAVAITTGDDNTIIGSFAGDELTTGSNNIIIGKGAQLDDPSYSNETMIGTPATTDLRIYGTYAAIHDGTRNRLEITTSDSRLVSPDGLVGIVIDDNAAYYKGSEVARISDITITSTRSTSSTISNEGEYVVIGPLTNDIVLTIDPSVTRFKIRDLNSNIGTYTVTLVMDVGVIELVLAVARDFVEVDKSGSTWYYYNFRNGTGEEV